MDPQLQQFLAAIVTAQIQANNATATQQATAVQNAINSTQNLEAAAFVNEMNQVMATLSPARSAINNVLITCGMEDIRMRYAILREGFGNLADIKDLQEAGILSMASRIGRLPTHKGGVNIGTVHQKNLYAASFWVRRQLIRGSTIEAGDFSPVVLATTLAEISQIPQRNKTEEKIVAESHPGKLEVSAHKWVQWKKRFANYIYNIRGCNGVRMLYLVHDYLRPIANIGEHQFTNEDEKDVYMARQQGVDFNTDNMTLFQILSDCLISTPGEVWIKQAFAQKDGRQAVMNLCTQYDGPALNQTRVAYANSQIALLHYNSEFRLPFATFVTRLKEAYNILEEAEQVFPEQHKVQTMLQKMERCNVTQVQQAMTAVLMNPNLRNDFDAAAAQLQEMVLIATPQPTQGTRFHNKDALNNRRNISQVITRGGRDFRGGGRGRFHRGGRFGGGGGRFGGRFGERSPGRSFPGRSYGRGRGRGRPTFCNGVDITDLYRHYRPDEFSRLPSQLQAAITAGRRARDAQNPQQGQAPPPRQVNAITNGSQGHVSQYSEISNFSQPMIQELQQAVVAAIANVPHANDQATAQSGNASANAPSGRGNPGMAFGANKYKK